MTANEILKKIKEECEKYKACNSNCLFCRYDRIEKSSDYCAIHSIINEYPYKIEIESSEKIEETTEEVEELKVKESEVPSAFNINAKNVYISFTKIDEKDK